MYSVGDLQQYILLCPTFAILRCFFHDVCCKSVPGTCVFTWLDCCHAVTLADGNSNPCETVKLLLAVPGTFFRRC